MTLRGPTAKILVHCPFVNYNLDTQQILLYSLSQRLIYSIYESTPKAVPIFFSAGGVNASAGVLLSLNSTPPHRVGTQNSRKRLVKTGHRDAKKVAHTNYFPRYTGGGGGVKNCLIIYK